MSPAVGIQCTQSIRQAVVDVAGARAFVCKCLRVSACWYSDLSKTCLLASAGKSVDCCHYVAVHVLAVVCAMYMP